MTVGIPILGVRSNLHDNAMVSDFSLKTGCSVFGRYYLAVP